MTDRRRGQITFTAILTVLSASVGVIFAIGQPVLSIRDDVKANKTLAADTKTAVTEHETRIRSLENRGERMEAKIDILLQRTRGLGR